MAFLSKLPDDPKQRDVSQWELLVKEESLRALLGGQAISFEVHLPKDTPIVNERARIFLRRMPVELADRRAIVDEHGGNPEVIAQKVRERTSQRLQEMQAILGDEGVAQALNASVPAVIPADTPPGEAPARRRWWHLG